MPRNVRLHVREVARRRKEDSELVVRIAKQIGILFPGCPAQELAAFAEYTAVRGRGRVGRTESSRKLEDQAFTTAAIAAVRLKHTGYDEMLARRIDRMIARQRVAGKIEEILAAWRMRHGEFNF